MMFLNIYIAFSILTFVLLLMQVYMVSKQLKREHPDVVNEFNENNKAGILENIFSYIKAFISCFVPIINIGIFYVALFESEKTKRETLNKYKDAIKKELRGENYGKNTK